MKKRLLNGLLTVGLCLVMLAGCGEKPELGPVVSNTVILQADGSIIDIDVEELDKDYYRLSDLQQMVQEDIEQYNKEVPRPVNGGAKPLVSVKEVTQTGTGKAKVSLEFQSADALTQYNEKYAVNRTVFYGTVSQAISAGYDVKGKLYSKKKKELVPVSDEQLEKSMSMHIFIVGDPVKVRFEGDVLYYSSNAIMDEYLQEAKVPEGEICFFVMK